MGRPRAGCPTDRDVAVCRGTNGLSDHFSRTLCLAGARMTGRPPPVLDWAETSAAHRFRAGAAECTEFIIGPAQAPTPGPISPPPRNFRLHDPFAPLLPHPNYSLLNSQTT